MKSIEQHPRIIEAWSGLLNTHFTMYVIHYTADTVGLPIIEPDAQIVVAVDRLMGMVVFGFHDQRALSEVWEMTNLHCAELREAMGMPYYPVRPMVVSSVHHPYDRAAAFIPPRSFIGKNERISGRALESMLYERDVIPIPFALESLREAYVLVEPFAPIGPVQSDAQSSRFTLVSLGA